MTVEVNVTRPTVALELSGGRGATGTAGRDLDPRTSHDAAGASRMAAAIYTMAFQGLGLGAMSAQAPSAVSITGGTITGITDLALADGGTGASTAAAARTNLGLGTGDSPQFAAINLGEDDDTTLTRPSAGNLAVEGNMVYRAGGTDVPLTDGGTGASTAADARVNLGLGTADTPEFTAINLGNAADTTITRPSAGNLAVEGNLIYRAGGTDVPVTDGGTGASTAAAAATNLGLGTGDSPQFTAINIGHATDTTVNRASAGDIAVEGNIVYRAGGTDVPLTDGGTGASSASAARTNLGLQFAFLDLGSNIYRAQGGGGAGVTNLFQLFNSTSHNSLEVANSTGALAVRLVADGTSARILINGTQVLGAQSAAIADASAAVAAPTKAEFDALVTKFNTLLARARAHGWLAT